MLYKLPTPRLRPTQAPILWIPTAVSQVLKRSGLAVDPSPPSGAEIEINYLCAFMVWTG